MRIWFPSLVYGNNFGKSCAQTRTDNVSNQVHIITHTKITATSVAFICDAVTDLCHCLHRMNNNMFLYRAPDSPNCWHVAPSLHVSYALLECFPEVNIYLSIGTSLISMQHMQNGWHLMFDLPVASVVICRKQKQFLCVHLYDTNMDQNLYLLLVESNNTSFRKGTQIHIMAVQWALANSSAPLRENIKEEVICRTVFSMTYVREKEHMSCRTSSEVALALPTYMFSISTADTAASCSLENSTSHAHAMFLRLKTSRQ